MGTEESAHEFGALNTLLLVVILGLCIISAYLIKQNAFYYLPESGAAIIVGLIVGGLTRLVYPSKEELNFLSFDPQLFFFLFLPPIIFEAGYSLKKKDFFANFWTINLYAVGGTIASTFVIGFLVYLTGLCQIIPLTDPLEGLLFGALISAVDPVATLSIMGNPELHCDQLLYSLVFGESVLNDAVAIVLFNTFRKSYENGKTFTIETLGSVMVEFTIISLLSVVVGITTALVCCYLCKQTQMRSYPEYEIAMLFLFAYGSYSLAEAVELSGIMSLFFSSIILSYYNTSNLSSVSQVTAHCIFRSMACTCEFFVFLYMGMGFFTGRFKAFNFLFIFLSIIFCVIARLFNIFPFSAVANLWRSKKVPFKMQVVMWFAGLRGAMSFALSMNMIHENKDVYVSTTLCVVIFTTICCGGLTEPVLGRMGMKVRDDATGSDDEDHSPHAYENMLLAKSPSFDTNPEQNHDSIELDASSASTTHMLAAGGLMSSPSSLVSSIRAASRVPLPPLVATITTTTASFWQRFDNNIMKPTFGGSTSMADLANLGSTDGDTHNAPDFASLLDTDRHRNNNNSNSNSSINSSMEFARGGVDKDKGDTAKRRNVATETRRIGNATES